MTQWIECWHHDITPIAKLPLPEELEDPCMARRRLRTVHRVIRQLSPRPAPCGCCTYHDQDWSAASENAIRLLQIAQGEGLTGQDAAERVAELATAEGLDRQEIDAIYCLVSTDDPLMLDDEGGIYEGRHRIQAMIDQGVKRTILVRVELLDPKTGAPA
jgi:hypothetical protein